MGFKMVKEPIEQIKEAINAPTQVQPKEVYKVVEKLPVQEVRRYQDTDGTWVNLVTIEEALTAVLNS